MICAVIIEARGLEGKRRTRAEAKSGESVYIPRGDREEAAAVGHG